jgi:hypothetical protein
LRATSEWCGTAGAIPGTSHSSLLSPFLRLGWKSPEPDHTREHPSVTRHTCNVRAVLQGMVFHVTQTYPRFQSGQEQLSLKLKRCKIVQILELFDFLPPSSKTLQPPRRDAWRNSNTPRWRSSNVNSQLCLTAGRDRPAHRRRRQGA